MGIYKGNVFDLIEKGLEFAKKHLPVAVKIIPGDLKRTETPLIPYDAIREALCNAVIHRDYSVRGASIGLAIYDDRMEIFNNGGLIDDLTVEMIKEGGHSRRRNPLMAEIFYRTRNIEKWGRGVRDIMIERCLDNGDPEPEIVASMSEFKVVFKFPYLLRPVALEYAVDQDGLIKTLSKRQQEIISILRKIQKPQLSQIEKQLTESLNERTVRRELSRLRELGLIESHGRGRHAFWTLVHY